MLMVSSVQVIGSQPELDWADKGISVTVRPWRLSLHCRFQHWHSDVQPVTEKQSVDHNSSHLFDAVLCIVTVTMGILNRMKATWGLIAIIMLIIPDICKGTL